MLYIKLFIEREKNTGQSAPECPINSCLGDRGVRVEQVSSTAFTHWTDNWLQSYDCGNCLILQHIDNFLFLVCHVQMHYLLTDSLSYLATNSSSETQTHYKTGTYNSLAFISISSAD